MLSIHILCVGKLKERFYEDAQGQPHFDNDRPGRFTHDVRLRYLYFMAEKTRLALLV